MIYLASPYSHLDPHVRELRYRQAMQALGEMLNRKEWAYSPIVHCHTLALLNSLPTDAAFWRDYNFYMLSRSTELRILQLEGWQESKGVREEYAEAERLSIPITYCELAHA